MYKPTAFAILISQSVDKNRRKEKNKFDKTLQQVKRIHDEQRIFIV